MLYRISVTERGLTGIANIFRSRLSRLDDLLGAGTVPLTRAPLALQIFHHLLGGGGVRTSPRLSRLLLVVERNGKKRSKARQK